MTAVLAVAAFVVTLIGRPEQPNEDPSPQELRRQLDAMRNEVRGIRARQTTVLAAAARRDGASNDVSRAAEAPGEPQAERSSRPAHGDEDEEARRARAEERADLRVALIDATLRREATDSAWAAASERSIREASVHPELAGSSVESLECRTTICRVDVLHDSWEAADHFGGPFLTKLPDLPRGMIRRYPADGDGRSRSVVFLAREGHRLPMMGEQ